MKLKPEFDWDENLREIPKDRETLIRYVRALEAELHGNLEPDRQVALLGEIGTYRRSLGDLKGAERNLRDALELIERHGLGIHREIQQKIRLAHVLQWKKNFDQSNSLFAEIIDVCRKNREAEFYLDFALQHAGKNCFDQKDFAAALKLFEEALNLRKAKGASADLIASTQVAIARTKELLREGEL